MAPDLGQRLFNPEVPSQLWSGDISYIATDEGWLYLVAAIDLFSRQVVGGSLQPHMQASLVKDALAMAWWRRRPSPSLILHSDRGRPVLQRRVPGRFERLEVALLDEQAAGITRRPSASGVGGKRPVCMVTSWPPESGPNGL